MKKKHVIFLVLLSTIITALQGQSLDDARGWYLEGRYADALPLFQKAYRDDPANAALNQWLGVSLLKTGRIVEAEQYLLIADEKKIPEAPLYLGELYSKQYRFEEAAKAFDKYQKAVRRDEEALAKLDRFRQETAQLHRRVLRTEDLQIIDSLILPKSEFLSAYHLTRSSGTLQLMHTFFPDLPTGIETLYLNERGDKMYYSKKSTLSDRDLYTMDKLIDRFGNEQKLPELINGEGDQAYPFVMSDGLTIYFASTGHQSLGGYDLYVTRYNLSTDTYLTPGQLNMPFNSPFNDYMLVIDEEKGVGWFASDRFQPEGNVCIYTFLPNPQVTLVDSNDEPAIYRRARIASIADSWREGVDYDSLREIARQQSSNEQDRSVEFEFLLNDDRVYHRLDDFTSSNARVLFSQALGLAKQLEEINRELNEKRALFANGGSTTSSLTSSVLALEKESDTLYRQIERLKQDARNEEIRNITD